MEVSPKLAHAQQAQVRRQRMCLHARRDPNLYQDSRLGGGLARHRRSDLCRVIPVKCDVTLFSTASTKLDAAEAFLRRR